MFLGQAVASIPENLRLPETAALREMAEEFQAEKRYLLDWARVSIVKELICSVY